MGIIANYGLVFPQKINKKGFFEFSGDIRTLIRSSIYQILGTTIGQRIGEPEFGSKLEHLLFEPIDEITLPLARVYTIQAIRRWEPRVDLNAVVTKVNPDQGRVEIYGAYTIIDRKLDDTFLAYLPRLSKGV